jgi:hypothetical protein
LLPKTPELIEIFDENLEDPLYYNANNSYNDKDCENYLVEHLAFLALAFSQLLSAAVDINLPQKSTHAGYCFPYGLSYSGKRSGGVR